VFSWKVVGVDDVVPFAEDGIVANKLVFDVLEGRNSNVPIGRFCVGAGWSRGKAVCIVVRGHLDEGTRM